MNKVLGSLIEKECSKKNYKKIHWLKNNIKMWIKHHLKDRKKQQQGVFRKGKKGRNIKMSIPQERVVAIFMQHLLLLVLTVLTHHFFFCLNQNYRNSSCLVYRLLLLSMSWNLSILYLQERKAENFIPSWRSMNHIYLAWLKHSLGKSTLGPTPQCKRCWTDVSKGLFRKTVQLKTESRQQLSASACTDLHGWPSVHVLYTCDCVCRNTCSLTTDWSLETWSCRHLAVLRLPDSTTLNTFLMSSTRCGFLQSHVNK